MFSALHKLINTEKKKYWGSLCICPYEFLLMPTYIQIHFHTEDRNFEILITTDWKLFVSNHVKQFDVQ